MTNEEEENDTTFTRRIAKREAIAEFLKRAEAIGRTFTIDELYELAKEMREELR
jgi:hypothetical protein